MAEEALLPLARTLLDLMVTAQAQFFRATNPFFADSCLSTVIQNVASASLGLLAKLFDMACEGAVEGASETDLAFNVPFALLSSLLSLPSPTRFPRSIRSFPCFFCLPLILLYIEQIIYHLFVRS